MNSIDLDKLEYKEQLLDNGNTVYYKVCDGIYYNYAIRLKNGTYKVGDTTETDRIIKACEYARKHNKRVRIWYGSVDTGISWNEEYNVVGYISQSTGRYKIPILLPNRNSSGGVSILTRCIIRIDDIQTRQILYKHPKFRVDPMEIREEDDPELVDKGYAVAVYTMDPNTGNFECSSRFSNCKQAENYIKFMKGERYCK